MRVLVLTGHLPFPPCSGGRRRELELLRRVGRHAEVELCAVTRTYDEDQRHLALARRVLGAVELFAAEPAGEGAPQVVAHRSAAAARHVAARLAHGAFDLVHVEGFYLTDLVPRGTGVPIALTAQNVEHDIWRRRAAAAGGWHDRSALRTHAEDTRRAEVAAWQRAALRIAVTEEDRAAMLAAIPGAPVGLVPDGCDHTSALGTGADDAEVNARSRAGRGVRPRIVMVANYAYAPSADGAAWFVREVLPEVAVAHPEVELQLVGNAPPRDLRALHDDDRVIVTGRVPRVEPYLAGADVVVCPLRFGGGVKVKVLEALAAGCAVVSTPVGAQGLDGARDALRVAGSAEAMAAEVSALLADDAARADLGRRAREAVSTLPTWNDAARRLQRCWSGAIALGRPLGGVAALP